MTARLHRVHTILRDANVPCALGTRPGSAQLLRAGVPDSGSWDVLLQDTGLELLLQDAHGTTRLPPDATDALVADTVKFLVARAWADQGDPAATALMAKLGQAARPQHEPATGVEARYLVLDGLSMLNPLHIAGRLFEAVGELGTLFLSPQPVTVDFALWSPWGTIRGRYTLP